MASPAPEFQLPAFENQLVVGAGIEIPGAAGGLRDAMEIEPRVLHQGDRIYVLLECEVAKTRHDPIDKKTFDGPLRRVSVLHTRAGTIMDPEVAKPAVDAQKDRIQKAKEEALGVQRIPGTDADVDLTLVENRLRSMTSTELRELCVAAGVEAAKNASKNKLVALLLREVPDLADRLPAITQDGDE